MFDLFREALDVKHRGGLGEQRPKPVRLTWFFLPMEMVEKKRNAKAPDAALVDLCHVLLNANEFLYTD